MEWGVGISFCVLSPYAPAGGVHFFACPKKRTKERHGCRCEAKIRTFFREERKELASGSNSFSLFTEKRTNFFTPLR